jgi:phosphoribosylformylglycinamidine cyclo-ligase
VRKVLNVENTDLAKFRSELGCSLGEELLKPTRLYAKTVVSILSEKSFTIKGMSHITGGGIYENLPRMLPEGVKAEVKASSWTPPAILSLLLTRAKFPPAICITPSIWASAS